MNDKILNRRRANERRIQWTSWFGWAEVVKKLLKVTWDPMVSSSSQMRKFAEEYSFLLYCPCSLSSFLLSSSRSIIPVIGIVLVDIRRLQNVQLLLAVEIRRSDECHDCHWMPSNHATPPHHWDLPGNKCRDGICT